MYSWSCNWKSYDLVNEHANNQGGIKPHGKVLLSSNWKSSLFLIYTTTRLSRYTILWCIFYWCWLYQAWIECTHLIILYFILKFNLMQILLSYTSMFGSFGLSNQSVFLPFDECVLHWRKNFVNMFCFKHLCVFLQSYYFFSRSFL